MGGLQKMFQIIYKFYWIFQISSVTNNKGCGTIYLPNSYHRKDFCNACNSTKSNMLSTDFALYLQNGVTELF